jgi:putative DNA primase/helicase
MDKVTGSPYTEQLRNASTQLNSNDDWTQLVRGFAIDYAEYGWHIIQVYGLRSDLTCYCRKSKGCKSPGKHPIANKWPDVATSDLEKVKSFDWTNMNIGIVTGRISDLYVIDQDLKNDGPDNLAEWEAEHVQLFPNFIVHTGGGGLHYYFKYPKDIDVKTTSFTPIKGVDIRADGGFVVAPPSKHYLGGKYVWGV